MSALSSTSPDNGYQNEMSLDAFFDKTTYDGFSEGSIANNLSELKTVGFQTIGDLRRSTEWRERIPPGLYNQIVEKLGIELELTDSVTSKLLEKWRLEVTVKASQLSKKRDHPFSFETSKDILDRQKQVYVGLEENPVPHSENNVTECDMLYGHRFPRTGSENKEPVFARISSKSNTEVLIKKDNSLDDVLRVDASEMEPIYVLVQQRGAGKSFQLYNTASNRFMLFFNMSTAVDDSRAGLKPKAGTRGKNEGIATYYAEVNKTVNSGISEEAKYNTVVNLTTKLMYAAILHFLTWKRIHPDVPPGQWFRYSFSSQDILGSILRDILVYDVNTLRILIRGMSASLSGFDLSQLVIAFDEAGELTTDKPAPRCFLPRIRSKQMEPKYSLFHPFITALILTSVLKIHRVISGTTLSLSHVSLGKSSAVKPEEVAILMISSLGPTSEVEIDTMVHHYFPRLQFTSENQRKWIGRSRFLYDILLVELFDASRNIRRQYSDQKEAESEFQKWFNVNHDACLNKAINKVIGYIEVYVERGENIDDVPIAMVLDHLLHDVVMGCRETLAVGKKVAAALIDCGVMHCIQIDPDGALELVQQESVAVKAIIKYHQERRTTYPVVDPSVTIQQVTSTSDSSMEISPRLTHRSGQAREDPIIEYCLSRFRSGGAGLSSIFEDFIMRYYQLNLSQFPSVYDSRMTGLQSPDLRYYRIEVQQFINEDSGVTFLEYLSNSVKYKDKGFFPPNLALADGALPIVKRPIGDILATIFDPDIAEATKKEHDVLPDIKYLFFQFKFYTTTEIDEGVIEYAVKTVNPEFFYTNKAGTVNTHRRKFLEILEIKTQPLLDLQAHSLGFVVTVGKVTPGAETFIKAHSSASIFHIDAGFSLPKEYADQLIETCQQYDQWCLRTATAFYEKKDFNSVIKRDLLIHLSKPQILNIVQWKYPTTPGLGSKTKEQLITILVGPE